MSVLAFSWPDVSGPMDMLVAALSEGYCPAHRCKLDDIPTAISEDVEAFPTRPSAVGYCPQCPCLWAYGPATWNKHSPHWLTIDDHREGIHRRLVLNPMPEVDDDEGFYEYDDDFEEEPA